MDCTNVDILKFKEVYRCKSVKFRSKETCNSVVRIVHKEDNYSYEHNQQGHSCNQASESSRSNQLLPQKLIDEIRTLYIGRVQKPKRVLASIRNLKKSSMPNLYHLEPSIRQIKYQLQKLRQEFFGEGEVSLSQLEKFLSDHSEIPEEDDEGFVIGYKIRYSQDQSDSDSTEENETRHQNNHFWMMFSTKRLLNLASRVELICADTTFKFVWLGFPVILIGTVDLKKQFHPLAFGMTSSENSQTFFEVFDVSNTFPNLTFLFPNL